jgi:hypothetical protein
MSLEDIKPSRVKRKSVEQELFEKSFIHDQQFRPKEHKPKVDHKRKPKNNRELQYLYGEDDDK